MGPITKMTATIKAPSSFFLLKENKGALWLWIFDVATRHGQVGP